MLLHVEDKNRLHSRPGAVLVDTIPGKQDPSLLLFANLFRKSPFCPSLRDRVSGKIRLLMAVTLKCDFYLP